MFSRKLYRTRVSSHPSRGFLPTWRDPPRWRITNKPTASKRKYTRTAYTENISQTNHSTTSDVLFSLLYHLLPPRTRFILVASYIIYINRILDYWSAPAFALFQFFISLSPRPAWSIKAARNGYKWIWSAKRTAAGGKEIWCAAFLHDCVATSADDSISSTRHATRELASDIYIYKCEGKQLELFAQTHDMAWKCDFFRLFVFFLHATRCLFFPFFYRNCRRCEEREEIPSAISPHSRRFWFDFPLRRVTMPRRSLWMRPLVSFIQEKAKKDPRGAVAHKVHVADRESSLTAYSFCRGKGRGR